MAKRAALIAVGLLVVWFVGSWLVRQLVSDETAIRWTLQDSVESFNEMQKSGVLAAFAEDYRDGDSQIDRETLGRFLIHLFLREKHPKSGRFRLRIELPEDDLTVEVQDGDPRTASVKCRVVFLRLASEEFRRAWEAEIEGELRESGGAWEIVSSRHRTTEGKRPF